MVELDLATLAMINEQRLWPAHCVQAHTRLARYAVALQTYLDLVVDAVRADSFDLETVLVGAEQVILLGEKLDL